MIRGSHFSPISNCREQNMQEKGNGMHTFVLSKSGAAKHVKAGFETRAVIRVL